MDSLQSELTDHHAIGTSSSHHLYHHVQSDVIRCPHHVALPDSERGSDRDVNNRTSFQVSFFPQLILMMNSLGFYCGNIRLYLLEKSQIYLLKLTKYLQLTIQNQFVFV